MKRTHKLLSILLTLVMLLGLAPMTAHAGIRDPVLGEPESLVFTTQPRSGNMDANESYTITWAFNTTPDAVALAVLTGNDEWKTLVTYEGEAITGKNFSATRTKSRDYQYAVENMCVYRIIAAKTVNGNLVSVESDPFTITWEKAPTAYKVYVATSYNGGRDDVWELADAEGNEWSDSDGYHVSFRNGVLTITNLSGTGQTGVYKFNDSKYASIYADGDLTIRFEGTEEYGLFDFTNGDYGIYVNGDLTIINACTVDRDIRFINSSAYSKCRGESAGIYCTGNMTIRNESNNAFSLRADGGNVLVEDGKVDQNFTSYGIYAGGDIDIGENCTVTAISADIPLSAKGETCSYGIYSLNGDFDVGYGAVVRATAGSIDPRKEDGTMHMGYTQTSCGVCLRAGTLTVNGGKLTATGGDISYTPVETDEFSFSVDSGGTSLGIRCGSLTLNSGSVTAEAGISNMSALSPVSTSAGVWVGDTLTVKGGRLTATADDAWRESIGIDTQRLVQRGGSIVSTAGVAVCSGNVGIGSFGTRIATDLTASGGTMVSTGGAMGNQLPSIGISARQIALSDTADVTGVGGPGSKSVDSKVAQLTTGSPGDSYGVGLYDTLSVQGGALLKGIGGTITYQQDNGSGAKSVGIYLFSTEAMTISGDGSVTATGGETVYGGGNMADRSYGMYAQTPALTISGTTVTATGGSVCTTAHSGGVSGSESFGLFASGALTLTEGANAAFTGGENPHYGTNNNVPPKYNDSYGAYVTGSVTVDDSVLTVTGGKSSYVIGLFTGGTVTLSGNDPRLSAVAGGYWNESKATRKGSYGIQPGGNLTASTGVLAAQGGSGVIMNADSSYTVSAPYIWLANSTTPVRYTDSVTLDQVKNYRFLQTSVTDVAPDDLVGDYEPDPDADPVTVTISGWIYGRKAMAPNYTTYAGTPSIRYTGTTNGGAAYDSTEPPTDAGSYTVTVTYPGGQTGSANFEVSPRNISGNTIFINDKLTYTGEPQTIKDITTNPGDPPLDLEADCTITGITVTDAGDYYATFTGKRNYTGTKEVKFEVKKAELTLDDFIIPEIGTGYVYNGEPVVLSTPTLKAPKTGAGTVTVYYGGSPTPPTDAGTYSIKFSLVGCTNFYNPGELEYGTLKIQKAPNPMRLVAERVTVPACGSVDLREYVADAVDSGELNNFSIYSSENDCASACSLTDTGQLTAGSVAGEFEVRIYARGDSNYESAEMFLTVVVVEASAEPVEISAIILRDLDAPREGTSPDKTVTSGNPDYYEVTAVRWLNGEGSEVDRFESGAFYTAVITVAPGENDGKAACVFVAPVAAAIDGNVVTGEGCSVTVNGDKTVTVRYKFPQSAAPAGTTVSGTVKAYNGSSSPVVKLYANGVEKYTAQVGAATVSGNQYTWNFTFSGVAMDYYDLVVTKDGHLTYTVENVLVTGQPLDLTVHANADVSTISMLCGDIDGNGWINSTDLGIILQGQNYGKQTSANGVNALADLDGNGWINSTDLGIVLQGQHYGKGKVTVAYTQ